MKYDVITFGSAILDVFVNSSELKVFTDKNDSAGKSFSLPVGAKLKAEGLEVHSGGGGTNTAVGFARMGLRTGIVARCGWDLAGKLIRQELKEEKVTDQLLVQFEGEKTDWSTILLDGQGNSTILVWRGETRLEKSVINLSWLNSFWFYLASLEGNLGLVEFLLDLAGKNHIKVAWNPGQREIEQKEALLALAPKIETLILNQRELLRLTEPSLTLDQAFGNLSQILPKTNLIITNGKEGVRAKDIQGKIFNLPGLAVNQKDQTGAGDGFASGFVAGLIKQESFEKALQRGIVNGASVVTQIGAKSGLIFEKELDYWLSKLD